MGVCFGLVFWCFFPPHPSPAAGYPRAGGNQLPGPGGAGREPRDPAAGSPQGRAAGSPSAGGGQPPAGRRGGCAGPACRSEAPGGRRGQAAAGTDPRAGAVRGSWATPLLPAPPGWLVSRSRRGPRWREAVRPAGGGGVARLPPGFVPSPPRPPCGSPAARRAVSPLLEGSRRRVKQVRTGAGGASGGRPEALSAPELTVLAKGPSPGLT